MPDKPKGVHKRILSQRKAALTRSISKGPLEPESPQTASPSSPGLKTPRTPSVATSSSSIPEDETATEDRPSGFSSEEPPKELDATASPHAAPPAAPAPVPPTIAAPPQEPANAPSPDSSSRPTTSSSLADLKSPNSPQPNLNKPLPLPTPSISTALSRKDFTFLLDPASYTKLQVGHLDSSIYQSAKLPQLIARGNFDAAADLLVRILISETSAQNPAKLLEVFYLRQLVLAFSSRPELAAEEAGLLGDLGDAFFVDDVTGYHVLSWELRLVVTGVHGRPLGEERGIDSRGAIIGYYEMAKEARRRIVESEAGGLGRDKWLSRLADLGWRIAVQLVRMGDVVLAREHLEQLLQSLGILTARTPLLWRLAVASLCLRVERPAKAEDALTQGLSDEKKADWFGDGASPAKRTQVLRALETTGNWELDKAAATWRSLSHDDQSKKMTDVEEIRWLSIYEAHCYRGLAEHSALQGDGNPLAAAFAADRPVQEVLFDLYTLQELYE